MNKLTMGQKIAARRKLLNLSQEALAARLEISRQAVSKWESDAAIPEIDKLIALSRLYGVSVGWLLGVEEREAPASDELTETQLKMVEEIVRRYQAPRKRHSFWRSAALIACVAALGTVLFFHMQQQNAALRAENAAIQDQIAALSEDNSGIQARIDQIDAFLKEEKEAGKLLRTYTPLCYLSDDAQTAEITFYLYPKLYQENLTAYLRILNREAGVSQLLECRWVQGDRYMVHASVPLADNYQYSFLLVSDTGYDEQILDQNTYFTDLAIHSRFYLAAENPKYAQMKAEESTPISPDTAEYSYNMPIYMPCIQEKTGFVPFRDVKIQLQHNGTVLWEEDFYPAFLELYKQDKTAVPLTPDIRVELPALAEGDRLILKLTATSHTDRTMVTMLDDLTVTAP